MYVLKYAVATQGINDHAFSDWDCKENEKFKETTKVFETYSYVKLMLLLLHTVFTDWQL